MNVQIDSDTRNEFRRVVRAFVTKMLPPDTARERITDPGCFNRHTWERMATELGMQGLAIDERFGGAGYGSVELAVAFEELGRTLAPVPFLSTVGLAAEAVIHCGDDTAHQRYLPQIAAGDLVATLAFSEGGPLDEPSAIACEAVLDEDGRWGLRGHKQWVLDAHLAELMFVLARTGDGMSLFAVDTGQPNVSITVQRGLDMTRQVSSVELRNATGVLIGNRDGTWPGVMRSLEMASVYLAAEMVGAATYLLEQSVAYASERIQFGKQIGTFQAIQHKCADMYVDLEFARSGVWAALESLVHDSALEFGIHASMAKLFAADCFSRMAAETLQIHGGIGFTWEHFAHLYLKRAKSCQVFLGTPAYHREKIAAQIGV